MSGKYALLNEWIGNRMGCALGIYTQEPNWVEIDEHISMDSLHVEVKDVVQKSLGINIGFSFKENISEISAEALKIVHPEELYEIFLLDLVFLNVDRTPSNLNLIRYDGEIYSLDYESSLLIHEILENKDFSSNQRILQSFRNNPLYQEMDRKIIQAFLDKLSNISFPNILSDIPESILSPSNYEKLLTGIHKRHANQWSLIDRLEKLKDMKAERPEDLKAKYQENQRAFKRKFIKNSSSRHE